MRKERLDILIKVGALRKRKLDREKIKSLIKSSKSNTKVALSIPLNEESSTLIFREIYESIRQLGDAKWISLGFESQNHEISLEILKEMEIKDKIKLNYLERFKNIRHDANYKGFQVSIIQAKEIIDFWNSCALEIIKNIS